MYVLPLKKVLKKLEKHVAESTLIEVTRLQPNLELHQ